MATLVDAWERLLIEALTDKSVPHVVREDLARSIRDGRWREQQSRLLEAGLLVAFIIEGYLRNTSLPYESTLGACVNAELRNSHVFRSWDLDETVHLIVHLYHKVGVPHGRPNSLQPPMTSKRQRDE